MSNLQNTKKPDVSKNAMLLLITRLHFYIGMFVAPFIFIAALTGTVYVLTPQLEAYVYKHELKTDSTGPNKPLTEQVAAARQSLSKDLTLFAVRPAPLPGDTTRVMFLDPSTLSGVRAVFIDPHNLAVRGSLGVYGTSGVLPLRTTIDYLHRTLLLGDLGRNYSELAASWLWIAALGGVYLWYKGGKKNQTKIASRTPYLRKRRSHYQLGLVIFLGLVFFSITGLTWSKWAGGNISTVRQYIGWVTPSVSLDIKKTAHSTDMGEHANHLGHSNNANMSMTQAAPSAKETDQLFDKVLNTARAAGIHSTKIEIKPPRKANTAWFVREIHREWPTQVDSVAIDGSTLAVLGHAQFAHFPLIAKLIRWGIDTHMGLLFGLANQLILAAFGLSLCVMIVWGYTMWWRRRPTAGATSKPLLDAWSKLTPTWKTITIVVSLFVAISLPVMGISLVVFLLIDAIRWQKRLRTKATPLQ
ncbi:PepSY-associated TM helix [Marinomonas spartinae]|uniref:PepSY-associated TM helix domain-containing protein n=1 Tax=Marinomonas spartinae TaxID=1792290 RepID=UPI000808AD4B|nr:PepSY-associated TM helix domain-containing protein [Marinomonas spartinae]SBS35529.1 PepSY-associated TM helix [Marinomonas spartinae]